MITFDILQLHHKHAYSAFTARLWCISTQMNGRGLHSIKVPAELCSVIFASPHCGTALRLQCVHLHPFPILTILSDIDRWPGRGKNATQPPIFNALYERTPKGSFPYLSADSRDDREDCERKSRRSALRVYCSACCKDSWKRLMVSVCSVLPTGRNGSSLLKEKYKILYRSAKQKLKGKPVSCPGGQASEAPTINTYTDQDMIGLYCIFALSL